MLMWLVESFILIFKMFFFCSSSKMLSSPSYLSTFENAKLGDFLPANSIAGKFLPPDQGRREEGARGTMTPGPIGFRKADGFSGPAEGPMSSRGAHQKNTEKLACEALKTFFFGDHLISIGKSVRILVKTFFFWWRPLSSGVNNYL